VKYRFNVNVHQGNEEGACSLFAFFTNSLMKNMEADVGLILYLGVLTL
jgi:hypothetical protein